MDVRHRDTRAYKNRKDTRLRKALIWSTILALIIGGGYWVYSSLTKPHFTAVSASSNTKSTPVNPFLGWKTYSNAKFTLQYPGDWILTESVNPQIGLYGTSGTFTASTAGIASSAKLGSSIALHIQIGPHNSGSWCVDIACKVMALIPLTSDQLKSDSLAVINQSGTGGNTTILLVVPNSTSAGASSISSANVGNNLSISGYPEYYSANASPGVARVTDISAFQAEGDVKDFVSILNSIKFK